MRSLSPKVNGDIRKITVYEVSLPHIGLISDVQSSWVKNPNPRSAENRNFFVRYFSGIALLHAIF